MALPTSPNLPAPSDTPPPRAFAQGVGLLLQTCGVLMFLTTCCLCASSFLWDPIRSPGEAVDQTPRDLQRLSQSPRVIAWRDLASDPGKNGLMLTIVTMTVGGLALASFGLGLQADRAAASLGAMLSAAAMTLVLLAAGAGLWLGEASPATRLGHGVVFALVAILLAFTIGAWRQVRRQPPPADVDVIPPGTKIPYSFYHDDPPDVRLADEIARRRAQLAEMEEQLRQMRGKEPRDPEKTD
ncbi:MAG: phage holin family protein [Phycisphaeraceae bacterium]|nr:phage holin family protein [Phycisphaeraceae bacterium]